MTANRSAAPATQPDADSARNAYTHDHTHDGASVTPSTEQAEVDSDVALHAVTPALLRDVLVEAGCRADVVTDADGSALVSSALHGTGFSVRFVNVLERNPQAAAVTPGGFSDISFVYLPRIESEATATGAGGVPPWLHAMVTQWNASRRFAQLALLQEGEQTYLALRWDVLVLGVSRAYLHACVRLWDQLMQALFACLRQHAADAAADAAGAAPVNARGAAVGAAATAVDAGAR